MNDGTSNTSNVASVTKVNFVGDCNIPVFFFFFFNKRKKEKKVMVKFLFAFTRAHLPHSLPHHTNITHISPSLASQLRSSTLLLFLFLLTQHTLSSLHSLTLSHGTYSITPLPPSFFQQDHWKNFKNL